MRTFGDSVPVSDTVAANGTDTQAQQIFRRVLVPVEDASQVEHVVELARQAGASEARVLHLNLHENIGGRRFALETEPVASGVVEAAVLELSMAGIGASGHVRRALVDKAAEAIVAEAAEWGADLIVLGVPRRRELATRLLGSVTLRVLLHAPCPVLVASAAGSDRLHHVEKSATPVTTPARRRSDDLSTTPMR
ncbi:MAG TPA: universal stress protein [Streptosporangiaceae bacterium]